jgi:8-oxo-dGTP pyrophosphatase MutT (NUDIX family)
LIALPKHRKRSKGKYDIPKGRVDEGESTLDAAFRECYEESNLTPKIINMNKPIISGALCLWVGEVDVDDEVKIKSNPHTGEQEHVGHDWISLNTMKNNCLNYLRPCIIEAQPIIWDYFNIWKKR